MGLPLRSAKARLRAMTHDARHDFDPNEYRTSAPNPSPSSGPSISELAADYQGRGWRPLRIMPREKRPVGAWANRTDGPADFAPQDNIGVRLGEPSGWLVDVDIDAPEERELAPAFLPPTMTFGRASSPFSHWLYVSPNTQTWQPGRIEIRSTGAQTVFPGSIHPSGEAVRWDLDVSEPTHISSEELKGRVCLLTLGAEILRAFRSAQDTRGAHHFMLAIAGALRRAGWPEAETTTLLERAIGFEARHRAQAIADTYTRPMDAEMTGWPTIARIVGPDATSRMERLASDPSLGIVSPHDPADLCDKALARRFAALLAPTWVYMAHVAWYRYATTHWCEALRAPIDEIDLLQAELEEEAQKQPADAQKSYRKAIKQLGMLSRARAVVSWVEAIEGSTRPADAFDAHPHLLTCANGTIDLRTATLLPHDPAHFQTKISPYPYRAGTHPRWDGFLLEVMDGDRAMVDYMVRFLALCLTGEVDGAPFALWHGKGANGKSVLLNAIRALVGDYAITLHGSVLTSKTDVHPTGVADLRGARVAYTNETLRGTHWNEATVKMLTGGDRIKARRMRQDFYEFAPTHKLIVATNERPVVRDDGESFWRRVHLVPFRRNFQNSGQSASQILGQLKEEAPAMLHTLAHVARDLYESSFRLEAPEAVVQSSRAYREDTDTFGQFLDEVIDVVPGHAGTRRSEMYEAYRRWCAEAGETRIHTRREFHAQARDRGWVEGATSGIFYWRERRIRRS